MQTSLFENIPTSAAPQPPLHKATVSGCTVDRNEAPTGFYAEEKKYRGYNICNDCDARKLCQANEDDWCLKNRCMPYEITAFKDGKTYKRKDGQSVIFKLINNDN